MIQSTKSLSNVSTNQDKLAQSESIPEAEKPKWLELKDNQRLVITHLALNSTPSDAMRSYTSATGLSEPYFWKVYATVKDRWIQVASQSRDQILAMLHMASLDAVKELHAELKDRNTENRNKAANDILDKVLVKEQSAQTIPIQVNNFMRTENNAYGIQ